MANIGGKNIYFKNIIKVRSSFDLTLKLPSDKFRLVNRNH